MSGTSCIRLEYQEGTLALRGLAAVPDPIPAGGRIDPRDGCIRFEAAAYADVLRWLVRSGIEHEDAARRYAQLALTSRVHQQPFPYQREALDAWMRGRKRGVVVLPTGSGKSYLAMMAIEHVQRSALVVVPTLDLVSQWYGVLASTFGIEVGIVGGGCHEVRDLCVTTYDSAHLHAERLGSRFGLVIYDECHHLPGESFAFAARAAIAPFRLGLTATLERADGRHLLLDDLIGPIVFRREITDLSGSYLADYETVTLRVELLEQEREEYQAERSIYTSFLRTRSINMSAPQGWQRFVMESARSAEGRRAFVAYRRQKELALAASGKLNVLAQLLHQHRQERTLVFTQDNATAYAIALRFLIPIITHRTKPKERAEILRALRQGDYGAVVTSKVLNEGVDVPEANVAVVLSGSGSVREHVQRLGRILRRAEGKHATLYELISASTAEEWVSQRRREHGAYR
ncbi:MAG: DEAD/DEAH box helicase family protein [Polyangiaceae bacterium]|nr:DEAD/DEAH box helicase family protein [Polyangiaceae bacterium]